MNESLPEFAGIGEFVFVVADDRFPGLGIEGPALGDAIVPDALPRRFQREVPAVLGLGEGEFGLLARIDVLDHRGEILRLAGLRIAEDGA